MWWRTGLTTRNKSIVSSSRTSNISSSGDLFGQNENDLIHWLMWDNDLPCNLFNYPSLTMAMVRGKTNVCLIVRCGSIVRISKMVGEMYRSLIIKCSCGKLWILVEAIYIYISDLGQEIVQWVPCLATAKTRPWCEYSKSRTSPSTSRNTCWGCSGKTNVEGDCAILDGPDIEMWGALAWNIVVLCPVPCRSIFVAAWATLVILLRDNKGGSGLVWAVCCTGAGIVCSMSWVWCCITLSMVVDKLRIPLRIPESSMAWALVKTGSTSVSVDVSDISEDESFWDGLPYG